MTRPFGKPGLSRFVFAALLVLFNWPALSIPGPGALFGWLFTLWGLAIVLLFVTARSVAHRDTPAGPPAPDLFGPDSDGPDPDGPDPFGPKSGGPDPGGLETAGPKANDV